MNCPVNYECTIKPVFPPDTWTPVVVGIVLIVAVIVAGIVVYDKWGKK